MGAAHVLVRRLGPTMLVIVLASGCSTHNYRAPAEPIYEGRGGVSGERHPEIRVVTFNIEYARRVGEAITALQQPPVAGADIIALQEMDAPGVERIAAALGVNYVYFPASVHPKTKRDYGNALLSPWPIERPRKLLLPHRSLVANQYRIGVVATVRVGEVVIRAYSVHLGSPLGTSGGRRQAQIDTVLADAAQSPDPVIILGDFNSKGTARRVAEAGYAWPTRDVGATARRYGFNLSFDHVFARGLQPAPGEAAGVAREGPRASDHWPVWARLAVPKAEGTITEP